MKKNMRRKFLVDKKVQYSYATLTAGALLAYTVFILAAIFLPHTLDLFSDLPLEKQAASAEVILLVSSYIWPWIILFIAICAAGSIFITHKIAGPAFALNRTARMVARGDLSKRVKLKENDDLLELAESFNLMLEKIEGSFKGIGEERENLIKRVAELEYKLAQHSMCDETIDKSMQQINRHMERLKGHSEKFALSETGAG